MCQEKWSEWFSACRIAMYVCFIIGVSSCRPAAPAVPPTEIASTAIATLQADILPPATPASIPPLTPAPTFALSPTSKVTGTPTAMLLPTLARSTTPPLAATLALTPTSAVSPASIDLLSRMGGPYGAAVATAGDYCLLSVGARFVVLDISNPAEPRQVGQGALLSGSITSITVQNQYAYIATDKAGVSVFDLSNVRQPAWVGTLPEVKAQQLAFAGDQAYGVDETGLTIYRVVDPIHWTPVSSLPYDGTNKHVAVVGKYAYVTGAGLHIVDVSDPGHPRQVGAYTGMEYATDLAVIENYVWVLTGYLIRGRALYGELHVVDISDPAKPARVNMIQFDQPTLRLLVANGFAYVGAYADLIALNAADPRSPQRVSGYRASGAILALASAGQLLLIASSDGDALRIISMARPEKPGELGAFYTPKSANRIVVADRYAYIADSKYGFLVMDIANPRAPVIVGKAPEPFGSWDIALSGGYLYVSSWDGLQIFRLVTPTRAVPIGALPLPMSGRSRLTIAGNRAYFTAGKVFVVDITQPDAPKLASSLAFPDEQARDLAITGHYAVIADADALRIVDLADSTRLKEVGSLRLAGWPFDVRVAGDYAYVVTNQTGLHVVNIANVTRPAEVAFLAANNIRDVTIAGTLAWVSDDQVGLYALDVSHPNSPVRVDAFNTKLEAESATVAGDFIYAVESTGGIAILRVHR